MDNFTDPILIVKEIVRTILTWRTTVTEVHTNVRNLRFKNCGKKVINKDDNINKSITAFIFVYRGWYGFITQPFPPPLPSFSLLLKNYGAGNKLLLYKKNIDDNIYKSQAQIIQTSRNIQGSEGIRQWPINWYINSLWWCKKLPLL